MFSSPFGLLGFDEDPLESSRNMMGQMDRMMLGMMGGVGGVDSFGNDPFFGGSPFGRVANPLAISPYGAMGPMMSTMNMSREGACHTYSSSSVMTMSTGPDGRPQVYQATSSSHGVPGGVRETKRTMCDSSSGIRKMAIGHHINDRSHVIEKEMRHGEDLEERQEFINLEEEEAPAFNNEFQHMIQQNVEHHPRQHRAISQPNHRTTGLQALPAPTSYRRRSRPMLSLTHGSSRPDDRQRYRDRGARKRNY